MRGVDRGDREDLGLSGQENPDGFADALANLAASGILADSEVLADVTRSEDPTEILADEVELEERMRQIAAEISSRAPEHDVQPSLDRVRRAADYLGNPQRSYRSVHITGTNGKTSTARMIASLITETGLRVGRFTSPHMHTMRERISIDGEPIDRRTFIEIWDEVLPVIELVDAESTAAGGPPMSTFEIYAILAYAAFADAPIDVAVVEVGMGGTWDATNIIDADVAVLTTVEVDHERFLGSTRADIAAEKLGIVGPGSVLVSALQHEDVLPLVADRIAETGARLILEGRDIRLEDRVVGVGGQMITVSTPAGRYTDVPVSLLGAHQGRNAVLAIGAVEALFSTGALSGQVVEQALMAITSPGRLETVRTSPTIVVDGAHNPAGIAASMIAFKEAFPGPATAVVGAMADKNVDDMLGLIEPHVDAIVVTRVPHPRAMEVDELYDLAVEAFGEDRVHRDEDLPGAIVEATNLAESGNEEELTAPVTIVIGSIELAARARELVGKGVRSA